MDRKDIEQFVFAYRGDNLDFNTALQKGIIKEDEFGRFWLKLTNTQPLDIIDVEIVKEEKSCQVDTLELPKTE